jgi:hypothetical protein
MRHDLSRQRRRREKPLHPISLRGLQLLFRCCRYRPRLYPSSLLLLPRRSLRGTMSAPTRLLTRPIVHHSPMRHVGSRFVDWAIATTAQPASRITRSQLTRLQRQRPDRYPGLWVVMIGAMLFGFSAISAKAEQPPAEGCRAASKIEYDSAKRKYLLRNRFGMYTRTGRVWRRHYWYCHL